MMGDKEFEILVEKALNELPEEFKKLTENIVIVTANWPSSAQIQKLKLSNKQILLLGLYEGIPKIKRRGYGIGGQLPDKITIFKMPVLMVARGPDEIERVVKDTVIHEIAHHFGLSDEEIHKAKRKY